MVERKQGQVSKVTALAEFKVEIVAAVEEADSIEEVAVAELLVVNFTVDSRTIYLKL